MKTNNVEKCDIPQRLPCQMVNRKLENSGAKEFTSPLANTWNMMKHAKLAVCYEYTQEGGLRDLRGGGVSIRLRCYLITTVLSAGR